MASEVEHFFMCLWALCLSSLEVSVQVLCPFFNWIISLPALESYEFFIHFGDQILVYGVIFRYIFLKVGSLYTLLMFSLAIQNLFILIKSHLFTLSFISLVLGVVWVKILLCRIFKFFLPMFSSRTFMVSHLIFMSFIHLEFILVHGIGCWSSFIFLHVLVQISQHH